MANTMEQREGRGPVVEAQCRFCNPALSGRERDRRGLTKIREHFAKPVVQCEARLGAEGMERLHRVRRCSDCQELRYVHRPCEYCANRDESRDAARAALSARGGSTGAGASGGGSGGAKARSLDAAASSPRARGQGEVGEASARPASPARRPQATCGFCVGLCGSPRPSAIVTHLRSPEAVRLQCVKGRTTQQWNALGVFLCGCGTVMTVQGSRTHTGCGHSGIGPNGTSLGEGRPVLPSSPHEPHSLHPTAVSRHRPHFPSSASARECPPQAQGGCGRVFGTFAPLYSHLKSTRCGDNIPAALLEGMGIRRCGRGDERGACRALLETHTVGTVLEHNRICNFRDAEGPGERGPADEPGAIRVPPASWELLMGLDMLQLSNAPGATFGYVPDRVHTLVTECWNFAAQQALQPASADRGFRLLQAFSSMLLLRKRGNGVSARAAVTERCQQFKRGDWEGLLRYARGDAPRGRPRGVGERLEDQQGRRVKKALAYASKGELSRAAAILEATPMAPPSREVLQQLKVLHPAPDPRLPRPEEPPQTPALVLDRELFNAYVSELPISRAPGGTGFRLEHLQAIVGAGGRDTLYKLCNHILAGGVPAEARPYFAGARLFALAKEQGGVRPIACGEVLRRVVATMVCRQLKSEFAEYFASGPLGGQQIPAQLGVGVRGGGEVMVHGLQVALENNPTWCLCTVDWRNAFNQCSRARMLCEVASHFPSLYPFVEACYSVDPVMVYGVQEDAGLELHAVLSRDGTQQGCPLGPLLFALLLHPVLRAVMAEHPGLSMLPSFLDDTGIPGPPELVAAAFKTLVRLGKDMADLTVNRSKCSVYAPSADTVLTCFPAEVRGARDERLPGVTVLAAAIGADAWVTQQVRETAEKAAGILPSLDTLGDPQTAYLLLSACVRPRIVHMLRACRPELCRVAMQGFHDTLLSCLAGPNAAVMKGPRLDIVAERFVALPARLGGLGFVRGERLADAAFLGSFALVWPVVLRLFPGTIARGALLDAEVGVGTLGAVREAHGRVTEEERRVRELIAGLPEGTTLSAGVRDRPAIPPLSEWQEEGARGVQKLLSWVSASLDYLELREDVVLRGDPRTRAWFSSVSSPNSLGASMFRCIPAFPALCLSPKLFPVAARAYLFQHQPAVGPVTACNTCQGAVDREGTHFLTCKPPPAWKLGNPLSAVHDGLVRTLAEGTKKVFPGANRVFVESREYNDESRGHRPDIVIDEGGERGENLFVEVSVIRPLAKDHVRAAVEGRALRAHEVLRRDTHYPAHMLAAGTSMVPFVADVWGCLGPESMAFFHRLAGTQRGWEAPGESRGITWKEIWSRRVAVSIARAGARTILERGLREQRMVRPAEEPMVYNRRIDRP